MRRPRVLTVHPIDASNAGVGSFWRPTQATGLPALVFGLLLTLGGCASMDGHSGGQTPGSSSGAVPGATPGPTASVIGGNLWSSRMEERRLSLAQLGQGAGIGVARTADNQLKLTVPADASFDVGRSELKPVLRPMLDEVSRNLEDTVRVTIVGHTDSAAGEAVNGPLSLDRAEAVREYLVHHGVRRGRLLVEGRGGRQPVASNATEAGRAANRRIEIFLSQPAS